jgi:hypothetical protein
LGEVNWELQELAQLLQNPSVSSINAELVAAAINAAYHLGTQYPSAQPVVTEGVTITLYVNRPATGSQMSQFEVVNTALTRYRQSLISIKGCGYEDIISDIDEVQEELMDQLCQITSNLIG